MKRILVDFVSQNISGVESLSTSIQCKLIQKSEMITDFVCAFRERELFLRCSQDFFYVFTIAHDDRPAVTVSNLEWRRLVLQDGFNMRNPAR